jgi:hypothetical protein
VKRKLNLTKAKLNQINLQIILIQQKLDSFKSDSPKSVEYETAENSFNSPFANRVIGSNDFSEITASRGILNSTESKQKLMPEVEEADEGYFLKTDLKQENFQSFYEFDEKLGCCRSSFFCF